MAKMLLNIFLITWILGLVNSESILLSAHAVFRHGARAPVEKFTSEEASSYFFRGLGQLSDHGIENARLVGEVLRDRYVNTSFLDKRMLPEQISFQSSGSERCLMTITTVGQVMFPHATPPVQTRERKQDYLLVPRYSCPHIINDIRNNYDLTREEYDSVLENAWHMSGIVMKNLSKSTRTLKDKPVRDVPPLIIEKDSGLAVPLWFNDEAYDEGVYLLFNSLAFMSGTGPFHYPSWIRVKSGYLLYLIMKDFEEKIRCARENNCFGNKKFFAYSSHDTLIMPLLDSLGVLDYALGKNTPPDFCALIIFELWMIDNQPKIKVLYRKKRDETTLMNLSSYVRNCTRGSEFCDPQQFLSCCNEYITADPVEECAEDPLISRWSLNYLVLCFMFALMACLIVVSLLLLYICSRRQNFDEFKM